MKSNKLITAALLALGLISSASASSTAVVGGNTYTVVYITGSTAFRGGEYNAVNAYVFDEGAPLGTQGTYANNSAAFNAYGHIGGQAYLLSFAFTGSEAGIGALEQATIYNPNTAPSLANYSASGTTALVGTPNCVTYVDPSNPANNVTAAADLAFTDTSKAVSLSASSPSLVDYGIIAVIPFTWAKGHNTATTDTSWNNLVNVTTPQLNYLCGGSQTASFFTGYAADTDDVYLIGRNKGSGTRANMILDTLHGTSSFAQVHQYAPANCTYVTANQNALTFGSIVPLSTVGLVDVANDGFESGSGVTKTLAMDLNGATDSYLANIITVGYVGLVDWEGSGAGYAAGAKALTLNGVLESDSTVLNGTYSFWGHEHLYGTHNQSTSSPGAIVAAKLVGAANIGHPNESLSGNSTAAGAFESSFAGTGGNEANPWNFTAANGTASGALDPAAVHCDKPSDAGYPSQQ